MHYSMYYICCVHASAQRIVFYRRKDKMKHITKKWYNETAYRKILLLCTMCALTFARLLVYSCTPFCFFSVLYSFRFYNRSSRTCLFTLPFSYIDFRCIFSSSFAVRLSVSALAKEKFNFLLLLLLDSRAFGVCIASVYGCVSIYSAFFFDLNDILHRNRHASG